MHATKENNIDKAYIEFNIRIITIDFICQKYCTKFTLLKKTREKKMITLAMFLARD